MSKGTRRHFQGFEVPSEVRFPSSDMKGAVRRMTRTEGGRNTVTATAIAYSIRCLLTTVT